MQYMSQILTRSFAKFLWLRERFTRLTARPFGRVGAIFVVALFAVFVVIHPVHAGGIESAMDFFTNIMYSVASLMTKLAVTFIDAAIQIMLYNSFSNNPVVSAGWAIVRDVVNMFFVIVLIIIAFGTIFGHSRFQWQQQVPKLMIFALVINFSKTLCGLMIDFAQVVMLTFANALREVAAGNFLQLLGMTDIWKINPQSPALAGTDTGDNLANSFNQFAAAGTAIFMSLAVLGTLIILTVVLLYRVIMLWVMIVLSPLAWFIGGATGIVNSNAYATWWDKFKCLVVVGPVLTFFLWLTLAVASAGATSTGFNVSATNSSGLVGSIFAMDKFMSFLIGLAMIYAGFDAAQQMCSSMSGSFLGKQLKGPGAGVAGMAGGIALKTTAWTARKAGAGLRAAPGKLPGSAWLQERAQNSRFMAARALTKTGRADIYQNIAGKMGKGFIGRAAGVVASRAAASARKDKTEAYKKAGERFKGDTRDTKVDLLERVAAAGGTTSAQGKAEVMHLLGEAAGDKTMQKQLSASGAMGVLLSKYGKELSADYSGDSGMTDKINKMKLENADVTGMGGRLNSWEDVRAQGASFFADKENHAQLEGIGTEFRKEDGTLMNAREAVERGLAGRGNRLAMEGGMSAVYDTMSPAELGRVSAKDLVEKGSGANQQKAVMQAMESGDTGRARELISMLAQALSNPDISPEKRFAAETSMDNIHTGLMDMKLDGNITPHQNAQIDSVLAHHVEQQDAATTAAAEFEKPHGAPPPIERQVEEGEVKESDIPTIAATQFDNASTERIVDAIHQLEQRKSATETGISILTQGAQPSLKNELEQLQAANLRLEAAIRADVEEKKKAKRGEATKGIDEAMSAVDAQIAGVDAELAAIDARIASASPASAASLRMDKISIEGRKDGLVSQKQDLQGQRSKAQAQIDIEVTQEIKQAFSSDTQVQGNNARIDEIFQKIGKLKGGDVSAIEAKALREQAEKLARRADTIGKYIQAIKDVQGKQR